jgi:hypothetical protein
MLPLQKVAWFQLFVFVAAVVVALVLVSIGQAGIAWSAFGVLGLWGLSPILLRRSRGADGVFLDERDRAISRRASTIAFAASYAAFVVVCMASWAYFYGLRSAATVSVHLLTVPVWVAFSVVFVVRAVGMLVLYGGEAGDGGA